MDEESVSCHSSKRQKKKSKAAYSCNGTERIKMDELEKYIRKTSKDKMIFGLFSAVFAAAACLLFAKHSWVLSGVMLLGAAALLIGEVTSSVNEKKLISRIADSPEKNIILTDFAAAESFADDHIRMGESYIFFWKMTELLRYGDIKKLQYFEHHDTDTHRTEPGIAMVLANGKKRTLCSLYCDDPRAQAQEIFRVVLDKNPDVEIQA